MNEEPTACREGTADNAFDRFGDGHLIKLVLEAVDEVDTFMPVSSRADFNPAQVVTLLTYCYARGIYSSEEIETRLPTDKAIAYICAGEKPDWHLLRQFRRQNIFLLIETMTQLLKLVEPTDGTRETVNRFCQAAFQEQARFLVRMAVQADSIAMDA